MIGWESDLVCTHENEEIYITRPLLCTEAGMTVDQRRLLHTWVGSPSSKAQSPWKEPSVGLGRCEYVRTPDRGRMLGQASHVHRHEKAPGPSRREGSFFATRTVAPVGLNSAVSHLHKGTVPRGLPGGSDGKATAYNAGDPGSFPGSGRSPGEGNGNPLQYSCLEKSHGWRSLVGYSPWGRKESDTTERLHFHFFNKLLSPYS